MLQEVGRKGSRMYKKLWITFLLQSTVIILQLFTTKPKDQQPDYYNLLACFLPLI